MLSKVLLGFSVPDNQPSMTAHHNLKFLTLTFQAMSHNKFTCMRRATGFWLDWVDDHTAVRAAAQKGVEWHTNRKKREVLRVWLGWVDQKQGQREKLRRAGQCLASKRLEKAIGEWRMWVAEVIAARDVLLNVLGKLRQQWLSRGFALWRAIFGDWVVALRYMQVAKERWHRASLTASFAMWQPLASTRKKCGTLVNSAIQGRALASMAMAMCFWHDGAMLRRAQEFGAGLVIEALSGTKKARCYRAWRSTRSQIELLNHEPPNLPPIPGPILMSPVVARLIF